MLLEEIMQRPVWTIAPAARLDEAYRLMRRHNVRHLPVVEGERLVGIVTDRDVRALTRPGSGVFGGGTPVHRAMTPDPITAGPRDPVEEAARLMRRRKVGCLPVLDGGRLAGIVTVTDLLDALAHLTGLEKPGSRLVVRVDDAPGRLAHLTSLVADQGINLLSVLTYTEPATAYVRIILRLAALDPHPAAALLRREGFDVVWPPAP
ncbi:MAG: CBS and ACT domain-containing protein [Rhodothermales bacterium]|nr:CBS and ACT domain-containing protein [Rhodothermales bacterium]